MSRTYSKYVSKEIRGLLSRLVARPPSDMYQQLMVLLGRSLGTQVDEQIKSHDSVYLACSVEDADYLATGVLETLGAKRAIRFACFWNDRKKIGLSKVSIAPIIRRYAELPTKPCTLVFVKSIVSGSCVVRTNLLDLIEKVNPHCIIVAAPVFLKGAKKKLCLEFGPEISTRFKFIYFAQDSEKNDSGDVVPGIGGSIYTLLGFKDQDEKNHYVPRVVLERRKRQDALPLVAN